MKEFKFIRQWKMRQQTKRKKKIMQDIRCGKSLLQMIDNHLQQSGQNRKQRRRFWEEFIKDSNVRNHIYAMIEQAVEGETKYKKKENK